MPRIAVLCAALLAFGLFCFQCLHSHSLSVQRDVSGRVLKILGENGIPSQGVSVDGRDVLLKGVAGSREISRETQSLVAGVDGVHIVEARLTEPSEAIPDARTAAVMTQGKIDSLLSQGVVEFDPSSARLTPRGQAVLDRIVPVLTASPALLCEIQGHTDSQGKAEANMSLSYRRAIATKNYLVNKGIAPDRLTPKAFGGTQPLASNKTAEGRRKNRRINFVLKEKV